MTKKKKIVITLSAVLGAVVLAFTAFAVDLMIGMSYADIKYNGSLKIARKKFGMDSILYHNTSGGGTLVTNPSRRFDNIVIGNKDGQEVVLVVPNHGSEEPYFTEWVLESSFSEVVEAIEKQCGQEIEKNKDGLYSSRLSLLETKEEIKEIYPDIDTATLDLEFIVSYSMKPEDGATPSESRYLGVGQRDGELVFFPNKK